MIQELYIQKSFALMGRSLPKCYDCAYCRLRDGSTDGMDLSTPPGWINPAFRKLPVAVNLLHGDPMLQVEHTVKMLRLLEEDRHTGPVVVITKGDFRRFPDVYFDLDLHFAFSTFGIDHEFDGGSRARFIANLERAVGLNRYRCSIEFRPIVCGVNDTEESIRWVMDRAAVFGLAVGYSGLQGKPAVVAEWERKSLQLHPYPGYRFGHKKMIGDDVERRIQGIAGELDVQIFRKTSCLVSHVHGLERDYNAHYYRPSEMGCAECAMSGSCIAFKKHPSFRTSTRGPWVSGDLPYKHEIVLKRQHECILKQKGVCEFPTDDCSRISGWLVKTDEKLTTADVRVTKWLTGMTVDADFVESPYLSDFWRAK